MLLAKILSLPDLIIFLLLLKEEFEIRLIELGFFGRREDLVKRVKETRIQ